MSHANKITDRATTELEQRYLPPSLQALAQTMGLAAVLALVRVHGGGWVHVPTHARPSHRLARLLGQQAFAALVQAHAGERLEVACAVVAHKALRDAAIRAEAAQHGRGNSQRALARRWGLTVRQIRNIAGGVDARAHAAPDAPTEIPTKDPRQLDIFG